MGAVFLFSPPMTRRRFFTTTAAATIGLLLAPFAVWARCRRSNGYPGRGSGRRGILQ